MKTYILIFCLLFSLWSHQAQSGDWALDFAVSEIAKPIFDSLETCSDCNKSKPYGYYICSKERLNPNNPSFLKKWKAAYHDAYIITIPRRGPTMPSRVRLVQFTKPLKALVSDKPDEIVTQASSLRIIKFTDETREDRDIEIRYKKDKFNRLSFQSLEQVDGTTKKSFKCKSTGLREATKENILWREVYWADIFLKRKKLLLSARHLSIAYTLVMEKLPPHQVKHHQVRQIAKRFQSYLVNNKELLKEVSSTTYPPQFQNWLSRME